jgi:hypothetical protein
LRVKDKTNKQYAPYIQQFKVSNATGFQLKAAQLHSALSALLLGFILDGSCSIQDA